MRTKLDETRKEPDSDRFSLEKHEIPAHLVTSLLNTMDECGGYGWPRKEWRDVLPALVKLLKRLEGLTTEEHERRATGKRYYGREGVCHALEEVDRKCVAASEFRRLLDALPSPSTVRAIEEAYEHITASDVLRELGRIGSEEDAKGRIMRMDEYAVAEQAHSIWKARRPKLEAVPRWEFETRGEGEEKRRQLAPANKYTKWMEDVLEIFGTQMTVPAFLAEFHQIHTTAGGEWVEDETTGLPVLVPSEYGETS